MLNNLKENLTSDFSLLKLKSLLNQFDTDSDPIYSLLPKTLISKVQPSSLDGIYRSKSIRELTKTWVENRYLERIKNLKSGSEFFVDESFLGPSYIEGEFLTWLEKNNEVKDQSIRGAVCRPWSLWDFLLRLKTFTFSTWSNKPFSLDPPTCCSFGWVNPKKDILSCLQCSVTLEFDSKYNHKLNSTTEALEYHKNFKLNLKQGHNSECLWKITKCNKKIYSIPPTIPQQQIKDLAIHINLLSTHLGEELPKVDCPINSDSLEIISKLLVDNLSQPDDLVQSTPTSLIALSLYGWYPVPKNGSHSPHQIQCWLCHRKLGLWNFCSDSNQETNSSVSKSALKVSSQHRNYCPIVQPVDNFPDLPSFQTQALLSYYSKKFPSAQPSSVCSPTAKDDSGSLKKKLDEVRELLNNSISEDFHTGKRKYYNRPETKKLKSSITPETLLGNVTEVYSQLRAFYQEKCQPLLDSENSPVQAKD